MSDTIDIWAVPIPAVDADAGSTATSFSTTVAIDGRNSVIFRKGSDDGWRVAVENPWGAAVLDATV